MPVHVVTPRHPHVGQTLVVRAICMHDDGTVAVYVQSIAPEGGHPWDTTVWVMNVRFAYAYNAPFSRVAHVWYRDAQWAANRQWATDEADDDIAPTEGTPDVESDDDGEQSELFGSRAPR